MPTPCPLQATVNSNLGTSKETPHPTEVHPTEVAMATEARLDADAKAPAKKGNQRTALTPAMLEQLFSQLPASRAGQSKI